MGTGERFRDVISIDLMQDRDFNAWSEGLPEVDAVRNWAFIFTHQQ
jgi:hypothetical protein